MSKNGQPSSPKTLPEPPAETLALVQLSPTMKTAQQELQDMGATFFLAERLRSDEVRQICIAEDRSLGEEGDGLRSEMNVRLDTEVAMMTSVLDDKLKGQKGILEFMQSSIAHLRANLTSNLEEEVRLLRRDVTKLLEKNTGNPAFAARITNLGIGLMRLEADRPSESILQQVNKTPPVDKGQEEAMEVPRSSKNLKENGARQKPHTRPPVSSGEKGKACSGRIYNATYGDSDGSDNFSSSDSSISDSYRHDKGYDRADYDTSESSNRSSKDSTPRRKHGPRKSKSARKGSRKCKVVYAVPDIHHRQKGPKHKGRKNLRPTNPLYKYLLSYRTYRSWDPSYHRTPRGTARVKDYIKRLELTNHARKSIQRGRTNPSIRFPYKFHWGG